MGGLRFAAPAPVETGLIGPENREICTNLT
jgi:hypothetical protein